MEFDYNNIDPEIGLPVFWVADMKLRYPFLEHDGKFRVGVFASSGDLYCYADHFDEHGNLYGVGVEEIEVPLHNRRDVLHLASQLEDRKYLYVIEEMARSKNTRSST